MSGRADEVIRGVEGVLPGESATARAAHESLKGDRRGIRKLLPFLGPAFIAAVAYVDPRPARLQAVELFCWYP